MKSSATEAAARAIELYNLKDDLGEEHNVAADYPDIARRLADTLSAKLRRWDAVMPIELSTGAQAPLPDQLVLE